MCKDAACVLELIIQFNIRGLLIEPTTNRLLQFLRAMFVGGMAFLADAGVLWIFAALGLHYLTAAVFGFTVGVTVNYILSKLLVFKKNTTNMSRTMEIIVYIIISAVGLGLTELFMMFFTETVGLYYMISKVISALLVFIWNYYGRKIIIYREKKDNI
jgi:putative flippase GtrA